MFRQKWLSQSGKWLRVALGAVLLGQAEDGNEQWGRLGYAYARFGDKQNASKMLS
jgi:hypothetical protein